MRMKTMTLVVTLLVLSTFVVATAPAAEAAPPNIGDDGGCGYFHWHNGDIKHGEAPGYHYHHCM